MQNSAIRKKIAELLADAGDAALRGQPPEKYNQLVGRAAALRDLDAFIAERNKQDDADQQETIVTS